jgi:hypothetical protein
MAGTDRAVRENGKRMAGRCVVIRRFIVGFILHAFAGLPGIRSVAAVVRQTMKPRGDVSAKA